MKKSKILTLIVVAAMLAAMVGGCGSAPATTTDQPSATAAATATPSASQEATATPEVKKEKVTINFWHLWEDNDADMNNAVAQWNAQHGDQIEVVSRAKASTDSQLAAIAAGEGPDIGHLDWVSTPKWAKEGALEPLDSYIAADSTFDASDFITAAWSQGQYRGKQYLIPARTMTMVLYYNKDLLAADGYTNPPQSIEELVDMCKKTTKYDASGNITQLGIDLNYPWLDNLAWAYGFGVQFVDDKGKVTFDTPEMLASYEWMLDLNTTIGIDKINAFQSSFGDGENEPFTSGKVVFYMNGDWNFSTIQTLKPDMNYGAMFAPPPASKAGQFKGLISSSGFYINAKSNYKNEAWQFLSYLTGKDLMSQQANEQIPNTLTRKSAMEVLAKNPNIPAQRQQVFEMFAKDQGNTFPTVSYVNDYAGKIAELVNPVITTAGHTHDDLVKAIKQVQAAIEPKANLEAIGN